MFDIGSKTIQNWMSRFKKYYKVLNFKSYCRFEDTTSSSLYYVNINICRYKVKINNSQAKHLNAKI